MNTVPRERALSVIDWARRKGFPCAAAPAWLPVDEGGASGDAARISWSDYLNFFDRIADEVGGVDALSDLLADLPAPDVDWMLGFMAGPREVYTLGTRLAPLRWPGLDARLEDLPDGHIALVVSVLADLPSAHTWFAAHTAALVHLPERLGLPPARLVSARIGTHDATWTFAAPHAGAQLAAPAAPAVSFALFEELRALQASLLGGHGLDAPTDPRAAPDCASTDLAGPECQRRLAAIGAAWQLTPVQHNVLRGVVRGLTNKEIAAENGNVEATVEIHVTRILRKSGASGRTSLVSRFWTWREPPAERPPAEA